MRLIDLRANLGLSQTELAKNAGVTQAVISRIEAGIEEGYSVKTMKKLADALGVKVTDIDDFVEKLRGKENRQFPVKALAV